MTPARRSGARIGLLAVAMTVGSVSGAGAQPHSDGRGPAWRLDLRPSGYADEGFTAPDALTAADQIAFGSPEELVVVRDTGTARKPVEVRAFVIDTISGKLVGQREWTRKSGRGNITATADGKYLSYTSDGQDVFTAGLATSERISQAVRMVSPDGRYFTTWEAVPGHSITRFFDAASFAPTGAEFTSKTVDSIAADRIAYMTVLGDKRRAAVAETVPSRAYAFTTTCKEIRPRFISDEVLVVFGCDRIDVVTRLADRLFSADLERGTRWIAPASRDGSRFAIQSPQFGGGEFARIRSETVRVFDVQQRREVFMITVQEGHGQNGESGIALSPDGMALAVNSVGIVQYFRLPPKIDSEPSQPAKSGNS